MQAGTTTTLLPLSFVQGRMYSTEEHMVIRPLRR